MKKIIKKIIWLYNSYIWNPIHFRYMKNQANKMHKQTGKRYFVVPATETKLMVVDNDYINHYNRWASKQKGVKKINIHDLIKMAYYSTSVKGIVRNVS